MAESAQTSKPAGVSSETSGAQAAASSASGRKNFADVALELGYCTPTQITAARADLQERGASDDELSQRLVQTRILTQEQARACERAMRGRSVMGGFEILEK